LRLFLHLPALAKACGSAYSCNNAITGGKASEESATNLIHKFVQGGLPLKMFQVRELSSHDADNPEAVHRVVEGIDAEAKDKFNLAEERIIADYTGGTKSMTSGMVLACTSPSRALQFMKPQRYTDDGRADVQAGSAPVAVDIRFELIPQGENEKSNLQLSEKTSPGIL
jgi:hypothetical protein